MAKDRDNVRFWMLVVFAASYYWLHLVEMLLRVVYEHQTWPFAH